MPWLEVLSLDGEWGRSDVVPGPGGVGSRFEVPEAGLGFGRIKHPRPGIEGWQVPWVQLIGAAQGVAGHHTVINVIDGEHWATHGGGGSGGTRVNGRWVDRAPLRDGDQLGIAYAAELRFHLR